MKFIDEEETAHDKTRIYLAGMETKKTAEALTSILAILDDLEPDERKRAIQTASTFFEITISAQSTKDIPNLEKLDLGSSPTAPFSERQNISPKEFLIQKKPNGEAQRVACLAFYLTHYRDMPHFKNSDLSNLNTEAAQMRISNVPRAVSQAVGARYLTHASHEKKQLSADGEQFVLALPDQATAALVMGKGRLRKSMKARTIAKVPLKRSKTTVSVP